jgi:hypothetical protein
MWLVKAGLVAAVQVQLVAQTLASTEAREARVLLGLMA